MKRLWMPLYIGDYLADTGHLTTVQHGAYLLLIMHYWMKGGLPNDDRQLMAIARMTEQEWSTNCQTLATFFASGWRHSRIDAELLKARSLSEKRAIAGLKGAFSKHGRLVAIARQMPPQSQSHIREAPRAASALVEKPKGLGEVSIVASPELINSVRNRGTA